MNSKIISFVRPLGLDQELKIPNAINKAKKGIVLAAFALGTFSMATAQTSQELVAKNDLKLLNHRESKIKKEKKNVKNELHHLEAMNINENSKAQFRIDFGATTNVEWKKLNGLDDGTFVNSGVPTSAFYDNDAKLVGTTTMINFDELPLAAQKSIDKEYKRYVTTDITLFKDNENNETNMSIYNTEFDDIDCYFVQLTKADKRIVLQVGMDGNVKFFTSL